MFILQLGCYKVWGMNKTYHFLAGLPRSGSTVLSAILNQNPDVYVSPQTDLIALLYKLESEIPNLESFKAGLLFSGYDNVMKSIPDNFYADIKKPVVIDKNRGWGTPYNFENLSPYLNPTGKVILTMRPILEVIASFVSLAKNTQKATNHLPYFSKDLWVSSYREETDAIADSLMIANGEIDRAIFSIANLLENHRDRAYVVWLNDLVESPQSTLNGVYDFLELDRYEHNFQNIQEVDKHNDWSGYQVLGLHDVSAKLSKSKTKTEDHLSDYVVQKYGNTLDFLKF